jgi:hypothetical protein
MLRNYAAETEFAPKTRFLFALGAFFLHEPLVQHNKLSQGYF